MMICPIYLLIIIIIRLFEYIQHMDIEDYYYYEK